MILIPDTLSYQTIATNNKKRLIKGNLLVNYLVAGLVQARRLIFTHSIFNFLFKLVPVGTILLQPTDNTLISILAEHLIEKPMKYSFGWIGIE